MGKPTGFIEFERVDPAERPASERAADWQPMHSALSSQERRRQAGRCMDCGVPFCQSGMTLGGKRLGCPLHNLIPEWNDLLWRENLPLAWARLSKTNEFPEFTGRVCPAMCESACTCGMIGKPVTVRENELSIAEAAFAAGLVTPRPPQTRTGRRVAVIGSGPAGLAAASRLNRRGHSVVVYERDSTPGGLLVYGISEMKLPKEVVRRRIALMTDEGVEFRTNADVGKTINADDILGAYDCVILAVGCGRPRRHSAAESGAKGVYYASEYLRASAMVRLGERCETIDAAGKRVVVVGAGDTATDCVATAVRQRCASVRQLIRKPASYYAGEPGYGQEEARAVFGSDPRSYETTVASVVTDERGRVRSVVTGGGDEVECELLLLATGFEGCEEYVTAAFSCASAPDSRGANTIEPQTKVCGANTTVGEDENQRIQQSPPPALAGMPPPVKGRQGVCVLIGDAKNGSSTVAAAIADGQEAAKRADEFLMGYSNL